MTVTKDECPNACAKAANGMAGCCEWQDDWSVCIFVPGEKTKQSAGQRAGVECTAEQGLLKQFRTKRYFIVIQTILIAIF